MVAEQSKILIDEIRELRDQYVAEVGEGRRVWPRSIKDRIHALDEAGIAAKRLSQETGVGYETILQWRFKRRQQLKQKFHQVGVSSSTKALVKVGTVTVPKVKTPRHILKNDTVTVTTPDGFKVDGLSLKSALEVLKSMRAECS